MSKEQKKTPRKLQVNRETLRTLTSESLGEVQGGTAGQSAICTVGQRCLTLHCTSNTI